MSIGWRSFLLRRLLARFRIGDDVVRHLSTFQRLGEKLESRPPGEMIPMGLRTVLRAVRTRGAAQIRPDWVWPYWLERQLDPTSDAFIPKGHLPFLTNLTHRNWTAVGALDSEWEAIVDPRGLVTPWFDGWSLDWWVRDREGSDWRLPSRDSALAQGLVSACPVVETVLESGKGRLRHRAYSPIDQDIVVVELHNDSEAAVNVAFALRPYNPEGLAVVEKLELRKDTVLIEGRAALYLPVPPSFAAVSTFAEGDCLHRLKEASIEPQPDTVRDEAGLIQAAFVYDLSPHSTITAAATLPHDRKHPFKAGLRTRTSAPPQFPTSDEVVAGWKHHLERGMRVRLPDGQLQEAVDANRAYLLVLLDGDEITPGPFTYHRFWFRDAAYQVTALDRWGFHREAERVLLAFPRRQRRDGFFYSQWREWDANGAAIWAIAEHYRLTRKERFLQEVSEPVALGARWIAKKCSRGRRKDPRLKGLLPAGVSAEHLGPYDYYYWDDFWSIRGLRDAAELLRTVEEDTAAEADAAAAALESATHHSLELAAERLNLKVIPAGPTRGVDAAMIGSLVACYPLRLMGPHDPWIAGTAEEIRSRFCIGDAFFQYVAHTGFGTYLTLQLAFVELEARDPRAWRRLRWLLDHATSTYTWPEAIHPNIGGGCMGDGHHGWASADFLSFIRNMLVDDRPGELHILPLLPMEWRGEEIEVRDAPTRHGLVSFKLTWPGGKPQLEWVAEAKVPIRAPTFDPEWCEEEAEGTVVFDAVV
jgi:hypothetical protein